MSAWLASPRSHKNDGTHEQLQKFEMNGCDKKRGQKILPAQHYKLDMAECWQICQFLKVRGLGNRYRFGIYCVESWVAFEYKCVKGSPKINFIQMELYLLLRADIIVQYVYMWVPSPHIVCLCVFAAFLSSCNFSNQDTIFNAKKKINCAFWSWRCG